MSQIQNLSPRFRQHLEDSEPIFYAIYTSFNLDIYGTG